jgi:hypothetical protein
MTWGLRPSEAFRGRVNFSAGGAKSERKREREREQVGGGGFCLIRPILPPPPVLLLLHGLTQIKIHIYIVYYQKLKTLYFIF